LIFLSSLYSNLSFDEAIVKEFSSSNPPFSELDVLFKVLSPFDELKLVSGMNSGD